VFGFGDRGREGGPYVFAAVGEEAVSVGADGAEKPGFGGVRVRVAAGQRAARDARRFTPQRPSSQTGNRSAWSSRREKAQCKFGPSGAFGVGWTETTGSSIGDALR
jgi:hypothetical protein